MIDFDQFKGKNLYVIGDSLVDSYVHGEVLGCQDGCPKFVEHSRVSVPGGAANAAESLRHSGALVNIESAGDQHKIRFLDNGKIVYRHDINHSPVSDYQIERYRKDTLKQLESHPVDGIYVADYAKGFLDPPFVRAIVQFCQSKDIPCVIDPRRDPRLFCEGAYIKCNGEFAMHWGLLDHSPGCVVTHGATHPTVFSEAGVNLIVGNCMMEPVPCVNHVGAGDCFGAWLTLGLAAGMRLQEAARLAHAAGRAYVRHPHNRPPWPHEIQRELDPVLGKVLRSPEMVLGLRESTQGRIVFANGVFRVPHAGHAWFLAEAKKRGDVLVVGVNDNVSAFRVKGGQFCMDLKERMQLLAAQQAVDWVVPFGENDPIELMKLLRPNVLGKGHDYAGQSVPGDGLCEVWFAPEGPFKGHSGDLIKTLRG